MSSKLVRSAAFCVFTSILLTVSLQISGCSEPTTFPSEPEVVGDWVIEPDSYGIAGMALFDQGVPVIRLLADHEALARFVPNTFREAPSRRVLAKATGKWRLKANGALEVALSDGTTSALLDLRVVTMQGRRRLVKWVIDEGEGGVFFSRVS